MKRYDEEWSGCEFEGMQESPDGEWVKYTDVRNLSSLADDHYQRALNAEARIVELESRIEQAVDLLENAPIIKLSERVITALNCLR